VAVVVGCGAVGTLVATALAASGERVTMLCMNSERALALVERGGAVRLSGGRSVGEAWVSAAALEAAPRRLQEELVVYAVRAQALHAAVEETAARARGSVHVFMQPGPRLVEEAAARLGEGARWGFIGLLTCVRSASPGEAEWPGEGGFISWGETGRLTDALKRLGLERVEAGSRTEALWWFSAVTAAAAATSALLGLTYTLTWSLSYGREIAVRLWREAGAVARELGAEPPEELLEKLMGVRGCMPRLLQDLEAGVETEADYLIAPLLLEAAKRSLYTPYLDEAYLVIKALEEARRKL
jgi:2-dehydropantoate 2-reductase